MNKKGFTNIILVIIIVILIGLIGYFVLVQKPEASSVTQTPSSEPELTKEIALPLLKMECSSERVQGEYGSCTVDISQEKDQWVVTITYDELYDDSIKADRIRTIVMYIDGQWVKGETSRAQQCWPGRGHQDFSTEPCI